MTTYWMAMAVLIPAFSSAACGILMAFALHTGQPDMGRKEVEEGRIGLFCDRRDCLVHHFLLSVLPEGVCLAECAVPAVVCFDIHSLLPGYPFPDQAGTIRKLSFRTLSVTGFAGGRDAGLVVVRSFRYAGRDSERQGAGVPTRV